MTASPAMEAFSEMIDRKIAQGINAILKQRARDMLSGILPFTACRRAAAIVARVQRRQHSQRKAA